MILIRSRIGRVLAGAGAALVLTVPMAAQADAATVRLHAATATGESLRGPSFFGTSVFLAPTNVNASNQKWIKTAVGGGYATYRSLARHQPAHVPDGVVVQHPAVRHDLQPQQLLAAVDARLRQRRPDREPQHVQGAHPPVQRRYQVRFLGGGQVGQNWHEHIIS